MNASHPAIELGGRARFEVLFAILLALFLSALDQTIVGTALPTIVRDLNGSDLYTWVVTAYLLTSTVTIPIYGKLSDLYGRKPLLMIGISLFLLGSALSGLSQEMWQLILFRGIQGLGAGALFPIALAVIGDLFTPAERGKYQGLFGAVFGLSALIGPALGGFLTERISWHWIFYINIPIGIVSLFVIARILPTLRRGGAPLNIDYAGVAVFTAAVVPLLIGLTNKQTGEWTDPAVGGLILLSLLLTAVFIWIERRAKEPIVPLALFRIRTYAFSILSTFFVSFGFFGAIIFLPLWLQVVQGFSPTDSGWGLLALLAGMIASSVTAGQIVSRTGKYKAITVGALAAMAIGTLLMTGLHADTQYFPTLAFWMLVTGIGIGPTLAVFTIIVQNAVPMDKLGVATSNLTFLRQIGGSIGLALAGTVFGTTIRAQIPQQLAAGGVPQQFIDQFASRGVNFQAGAGGDLATTLRQVIPPQFQSVIPVVVHAVGEALSLAVANVFWVSLAAVVVSVVASLFIEELPLRTTTHAQELARRRTAAAAPAAGSAPAVSSSRLSRDLVEDGEARFVEIPVESD